MMQNLRKALKQPRMSCLLNLMPPCLKGNNSSWAFAQ